MGQMERVMTRVQIHFVAMPAQIFGGIVMLAAVCGAMTVAWRHGLEDFLGRLPGSS